MEFKPDKCELLRITRKRNKLIFPCTLHNKELGTIDATKYLGATYTISKGLSWSSHIYNITQKQTTFDCELDYGVICKQSGFAFNGVLQVINIGKKLTRERPLRDNERTYNVSEVQPPTTPFCE
jgi:hypothetical protein